MWLTKKTGCRDYTNELIERVENGLLDWESVARAALCYMSEDDVRDMAECNELIEDDEDEDNEDEAETEFICTLDGCEVRRVETEAEALAWLTSYDGDKDADYEEVPVE